MVRFERANACLLDPFKGIFILTHLWQTRQTKPVGHAEIIRGGSKFSWQKVVSQSIFSAIEWRIIQPFQWQMFSRVSHSVSYRIYANKKSGLNFRIALRRDDACPLAVTSRSRGGHVDHSLGAGKSCN